jgi:hypothetical protein
MDLHGEARLSPVGRVVDVGPVEAPDDEHVDVVRRRSRRAVIAVSPGAEDQDLLGVSQVELARL